MTIMTKDQQRQWLTERGWPLDQHPDDGHLFWATVAFQEAAGIHVDGLWGEETQKAAYFVGLNGNRVTAHFSPAEFQCKCWAHGYRGDGFCNGWITVKRDLLVALEHLRDASGGSIVIASGYRCQAYNDTLSGSASNSQHVQGDAADPVFTARQLGYQAVRYLSLFGGIGYQIQTGVVRHVDTRPVDVHNPDLWTYS